VQLRPHWPVAGFERSPAGAVTGVIGPAGRLPVDRLVVCAGAYTHLLLDALGVRLNLQAGKGYSLSVRPAVMPRRPLYLSEAKVAVTPRGSHMRLAGTMEFAGLDERIDIRRIDAILRSARRYLPAWDPSTETDPWCGLRPMTPDGLPVIDRVPGAPNATVGTGHGMLGVTLAPATGNALAELALDGSTDPRLAPFSLARQAVLRGPRTLPWPT
jgi:D-amino-acid dehydrogenase